jgi:hypothetical protein
MDRLVSSYKREDGKAFAYLLVGVEGEGQLVIGNITK